MNLDRILKIAAANPAFNQAVATKAVVEQSLQTLRDLRPWWFVVLPLLAWQARKTYKAEQRKALLEQARIK